MAHLQFIVVDELHAFIGAERGRQLQSLMHRLEIAAHRPVARIGLSATLGDTGLASEFLRPGRGEHVKRITSHVRNREVRMQVRGYRRARALCQTVPRTSLGRMCTQMTGQQNLQLQMTMT